MHLVLLALCDPPERAETVVTTITIHESEIPVVEPPAVDEVVVVAEDVDDDPAEVDQQPANPAESERSDVMAVIEPLPSESDPEPEIVVVATEEEAVPAPPPAPEENLRSVFQPDRGEEPPDVASALAAHDNRTDVETMPEEIVEDSPDPGQPEDASEVVEAPEEPTGGESSPSASEVEVGEDEADSAEQIASNGEEFVARGEEEATADQNAEASEAREALDAQASVEPVEAEPEPPAEPVEGPGPQQVASPLDMFRPRRAIEQVQQAAQNGSIALTARGARQGIDDGAYHEVFGERDRRERAVVDARARASSLAGDHDLAWERTRQALENHDIQVTPGTEVSLNTRGDEYAEYIHYLHNKIHDRWWDRLRQWDLYAGPGDQVSDLSLIVRLEYGISSDGEVEGVSIADGSGSTMFDAPAINLLWDIGPHRPPPPGMIGSDGSAYISWSFHRDNRGCGTFAASGHRVQLSEGEGG
ncbi:MAG: hypothetical protein ACJAYU_001192 [Bradymonadia bacterium]|jgi:hypothetical protein